MIRNVTRCSALAVSLLSAVALLSGCSAGPTPALQAGNGGRITTAKNDHQPPPVASVQPTTTENRPPRKPGDPFETMLVAPFGETRLYRKGTGTPEALIIFLTGDGGFGDTMASVETMLSDSGYALWSVNTVTYLNYLKTRSESCDSPATDIEAGAKNVEKELGFAQYHPPLIIGYSSGATLAYAALVESPKSFLGALSLGFCPDLEISRPFCKGEGLESTPARKSFVFAPDTKLSAPWHILQGDIDRVCNADQIQKYAAKVPGSHFVGLDKVGHGYHSVDRWREPFLASVHQLVPDK